MGSVPGRKTAYKSHSANYDRAGVEPRDRFPLLRQCTQQGQWRVVGEEVHRHCAATGAPDNNVRLMLGVSAWGVATAALKSS